MSTREHGDTRRSPPTHTMWPMGKQSSVTYDGQGNVISTTTVTTHSGCGSGCGTMVAIVAFMVVLVYPATYFPLPLAVLAYVVPGLILMAGVSAAAHRAGAGRGA